MIELPESPDAPVLLHGDCLDLLALLPDASVHVVVTDPPAGIGFMHDAKAGRTWDSFTGYQPRTARGREVMDRYHEDSLLRRAGDLLLGLSLSSRTEGLPARDDAAEVAELIAERLRSPLAKLPAWAVGFVAFLADVWSEVDRVLKPGGWICAWALPKTADLAGAAGRAVGWEIHDSLLHLFGGSMPKGDNISKRLDKMAGAKREVVGKVARPNGQSGGTTMGGSWQDAPDITAPATDAAKRWDGWNTQLAPGHEQWLLFRKPTRLTYAANALTHCTGVLHVDACRIPRGDVDRARAEAAATQGSGLARGEVYGEANSEPSYTMDAGGSWPRNVVITRGVEECPAEALDRQSGTTTSPTGASRRMASENMAMSGPNTERISINGHGDSGGASRYFTRFDDRVTYKPKASDRGAGLRSDIVNAHPTHKHVDLMRWLVRLLAATAETTGDEAAIVLDPFMGSGTTGVACVAERVRFVGIDRDAASFEVGRARVLAAIGSPEAAAEANAVAPEGSQLALL